MVERKKESMLLYDYAPEPTLTLRRTEIKGAKFRTIDAHHHLHKEKTESLDAVVELMDEMNIQAVVNLSGGFTLEKVKESADFFDRGAPGRFYTFCCVETPDVDEPGFKNRIRTYLTESVKYGIKGVKLFKEMGLRIKDSKGKTILPDDDRLRIVWETAAELGVPVLYHIADPLAFFRPLDEKNERLEQIWDHPNWYFGGPGFPSHEELLECQERLLDKNPQTMFILPHAASRAENLDSLAGLLKRYSNFYYDLSARLHDFSRIPYSGRKFLIEHADRAMFGLDNPMSRDIYRVCFRILETDDEYFNFKTRSDNMGPGARYMNYGLYLPDDVLKKICHDNAAKLLGLPPLK